MLVIMDAELTAVHVAVPAQGCTQLVMVLESDGGSIATGVHHSWTACACAVGPHRTTLRLVTRIGP